MAIVTFTAFNAWAFFAYSQSRTELESDHAAKRVRLEALYRDAARTQEQIKQKNIQAANAKAAFTNGLLERRRFSWTDLLNSLEEVQPYQVRLQSLIPRIQEKGILIEARGVAKDLRAYWNFQQNLINHSKFRRVYPGGYLHNSDAGEYIFNVAFNYFPEGAPMNVQGLTPELAGITQAPGEGPSAARPADDEEDEPPVARGRDTGGEVPPPARADAGPADLNPAPPPPPSAHSGSPRRSVGPPGVPEEAPPDPRAQVEGDSGGGRGPSAQRPFAAGLNTATVGGPQPQPPAGDAGAGTRAGRWQGRGAMPGEAGKRPPAPKKPDGLPTISLPQKPEPSEEDDEEQGEKKKGEEDDR